MPIVFGSKEALEQRYRDALKEALVCRECGEASYVQSRCDDCDGSGYEILDEDEEEYKEPDECGTCFGSGRLYGCSKCDAEIAWYEYESAQEGVKRRFGKLPDDRKMAARYVAAEEMAALA